MTRGEYLSAVEEQIRCRQVKSMVREELEAHMEDQKEAYMQEGKSEEALPEKTKPFFLKNTSFVEKQEEKTADKIKDTTCETKKEMRTFLEGSDLKFL